MDATATTEAPATDGANVGATGATDATTTSTPATTVPAEKKRRGRKPAAAKPAAEPVAATTDAKAAEGEAPAAPPAAEGDKQQPLVGSVLIKRDRHGTERCRCTIVEGGVEYAGKVHKSLSAAAIAASRDLGNQTKQTNGWTFWGLTSKPHVSTTKALDLDVIARAWDRYRERAEAAVTSASDDDKAKVRDLLLAHSTALFGLATPAAPTAGA